MVFTIARKELVANLLSMRFAVAFGACAMLLGLSSVALVDELERRVNAHAAQLIEERAELDNVKVYGQLLEYPTFTHRPPSALSVFSEGLERRFGNVLHFSHGRVPTTLTSPKEGSPLMDAFPAFDLATVAQLLLSLVALFFAYDAVSGERQAGTLALVASHPVPRAQVVLGKWLGGLASTCVPAGAGFLVALLVLANSPVGHLAGGEWLRVAVMAAATLLFLSAFFLAGLLLSVYSERPATSLVLAISVWAMVTVILPTTATFLIGELMPMEREELAQEERQATRRRIIRELGGLTDLVYSEPLRGRTHGSWELMVISGFPRELYAEVQALNARTEPCRIAAAEEIARAEDHVLADRVAQVRLDRLVGRVFVAPAYGAAVAALAGTDLASFERFIQHARRCRLDLVIWLQQSDIFRSPRYFTADDVDQAPTREELTAAQEELQARTDLTREQRREAWRRIQRATDMHDWPPVDLSRMPEFPPFRPTLAETLPEAATDLAVLALVNVVLLLACVHGFLRREVV